MVGWQQSEVEGDRALPEEASSQWPTVLKKAGWCQGGGGAGAGLCGCGTGTHNPS